MCTHTTYTYLLCLSLVSVVFVIPEFILYISFHTEVILSVSRLTLVVLPVFVQLLCLPELFVCLLSHPSYFVCHIQELLFLSVPLSHFCCFVCLMSVVV